MTPYPLGKAPSQRFRFEHFLKFMEENGSHWDFEPFVSPGFYEKLYNHGSLPSKMVMLIGGFASRFLVLFKLHRYQIVFIHRELTPFGPPIFEWIIAKLLRKKIIYDFDDAIWLTDQHGENQIWKWLKRRSKVKSICKWSGNVSVGNEYLAKYTRRYNQNVVVMPTVVDTEVHVPEIRNQKSEAKRPIIGWTGSHSTLKYLDLIIPALQKLEKETDFEFRVIANQDPQLPLKNYQFVTWKKESEIEDLRAFEIGVMPLPDDEWAKGKCGFKLIQYLSLEIPAVASPAGVNKEIILDQKNGFLAHTEKEWVKALTILINDVNLRKKIGQQGRELIMNHYSVDAQKQVFFELFV